ncbi:hypothetical protein [Lentzea sp. NPDC051838]|uniref:hypothetical protein n=1 Tax=Lentzea sp. NPDC051838 TaxID=3154849 RepID=UPI0034223494
MAAHAKTAIQEPGRSVSVVAARPLSAGTGATWAAARNPQVSAANNGLEVNVWRF